MAYTTINKGSSYFNTVTYSGNGTNPTSITTVGFKPDWLWIKCRSDAASHCLFDAVRGPSKRLISNNANAESTETQVTSFDTNGWTMDADTANNGSGRTYVAWNWLASNTTTSNTSGTISSTVSVNQTAGFSIVSYTGTGANATVGHGLGVAPKMVIVKGRSTAYDWVVWQTSLAALDFIILNKTDAKGTAAAVWNSTIPTSTVFSLGSNLAVNESGATQIAYCFADIKGYSKFGSYVGNGNANGTFIYTGFRPSFFLIKNTTTAGNGWHIFDNKRIGFNTSNYQLSPNDAGAEDTTTGYTDILSNGFKMRSTNDFNNKNGDTYIYMAFAENPFVSSTQIPTTAR